MKAILKFKLPEEATEYKMAIFGSKYHNILFDFDQQLKIMEDNNDIKTVEEIRNYLWELLKEENIDLYTEGL